MVVSSQLDLVVVFWWWYFLLVLSAVSVFCCCCCSARGVSGGSVSVVVFSACFLAVVFR